MPKKIVPDCRYGHGILKKIAPDGEAGVFGFADPSLPGNYFVGDIYVCTECGYTEFFDNEPRMTAQIHQEAGVQE